MQCSWRGCGWRLLKLFLFLPQGSHPNLSHPTKPQNNLTFYWNCYKVPSLTFSEVFFVIIPLGFTIPTYHEEKEILNTDRWPWEKKIPYFQTSYARRKKHCFATWRISLHWVRNLVSRLPLPDKKGLKEIWVWNKGYLYEGYKPVSLLVCWHNV